MEMAKGEIIHIGKFARGYLQEKDAVIALIQQGSESFQIRQALLQFRIITLPEGALT